MNINRNNYEEFFLLYVDNELSDQEKNTVDAFLVENPDLQEELLMLQQSILIPDDSVFADKENLFREEAIDSEIQQQLLLMLDNELDKTTKEKLIGLTEKDAAVKMEWEILQQTKLSAEDKIIFEDKAILYKKEGGRVISVRWWRIAAAAVVIGFGVWGISNYSNKPGNIQSPEIVNNTAVEPLTTVIPGNQNEQPAVTDKHSLIDASAAVNVIKQEKEVKATAAGKIKTAVINSKDQKEEVLQSKDIAEQKQIKQPPSNNLPKPLENINSNGSNNYDVVTVTPSEDRNKNKIAENNSSKENDVAQPAETTIPANSFAVQTKNLESDNEALNDEDENKDRKSKIGGFFKKLKRVVERKTNTKSSGDNSFKIANLSFAMQ